MSTYKVIYISGMPRSGSTMLGKCLGQIQGASDIGEFWALWRPAWRQGDLCGCGEPVNQCAFWKQVVTAALPSPIELHGARMGDLHRKHMGTLRAPWLAFKTRSRTLRGPLREYAVLLDRHYRAVCNVSGGRVIIDSSKMASDALIASTLEGADLYIVHLIRDPRGVAWSWSKSWTQPGKAGRPFDRYSAFGTSVRWIVYNCFSLYLRRRVGRHRFFTIKYETLIHDPARLLTQLIVQLDEDPDDLQMTAEKSTIKLKQISHPAWGNPMRITTGSLQLWLDDDWKAFLTPYRRRLITILCGPLLLAYRYPLTKRS